MHKNIVVSKTKSVPLPELALGGIDSSGITDRIEKGIVFIPACLPHSEASKPRLLDIFSLGSCARHKIGQTRMKTDDITSVKYIPKDVASS